MNSYLPTPPWPKLVGPGLPAFLLDPDAACVGKPSEWFFPDRYDQKVIGKARAVCADCPFSTVSGDGQCRAHALEHERFGVWDQMTPRQRWEMGGVYYGRSRKPGKAPAGVAA